MNYLKEIMAFDELVEIERITPGEQALWRALMSIANRLGWPDAFTTAVLTLQSKACLNEQAVYRARNRLVQRGLISVAARGSNKAASYTINSITKSDETDTYTSKLSGSLSGTPSGSLSGTPSGSLSGTPSGTVSALYKLNKTKLNKMTPHNPPRGAEERFDLFWAAYPKKVAKPAARKAFDRLKPCDGLIGLMLAALEKHKATDQWTRDSGQFIPNPATWLNQKRWEDDLPAGVKGRKVSAQQYSQRAYTDHDLQGDTDWLAVAQQEAGMRGATP